LDLAPWEQHRVPGVVRQTAIGRSIVGLPENHAMTRQSRLTFALLGSSLALVVATASAARAEDLFSALFRALGGHRQSQQAAWPLGYGNEQPWQFSPKQVDGGPAYCVRTCDGRYFPVPAAANQSRADSCRNFCPASETKVFYGPTIDGAASNSGKLYSELPNAFKYRSELVAGCTCNGTDPVGLVQIGINDDKTIRRGDMVVAPDGVKVVTGRTDRTGASLDFTPAPASVRARFQHNPDVAAR
jgi:hypothetical protein